MALQDLRQHYDDAGIEPADLAADPFEQFRRWFADAEAADIEEPNAFNLATVSPEGRPHARIVLLKGVDEASRGDGRGFVFYSNYESDKARDLDANPAAAMNFYWDRLHRCVRIDGAVSKVGRGETEAYFHSRPRASQLGAWCSNQSSVIPGRGVLEAEYDRLDALYPEGTTIPVPPFWGGYRVTPTGLEFWQGRPSRLHDRLRYRRDAGRWIIERLSP